MKNTQLTVERLKELIEYDPDTGIMKWRKDQGRALKGSEAGKVDNKGYRSIQINGTGYAAHRLAYLYVTGRWPAGIIDHIDRNKTNNAWSNLRNATRTINNQNCSPTSNNSSGYRGVSFHKASNKWRAEIGKNAKKIFLGLFMTTHDAAKAYNQAAVNLYDENAFQNQILNSQEVSR